MEIKGDALTMKCPRCSIDLLCHDTHLQDVGEECKERFNKVDPNNKLSQKVVYCFYCESCNMTVTSETYLYTREDN